MGKFRVCEVAKELEVSSADVICYLGGIGEFVKSASSTLEGPVVQRVRDHFRNRGAVPRPSRPEHRLMAGTAVPMRPRRRREWYRGEPPHGLTKFLLDEWIVPMRGEGEPTPGTKYWADEVDRAQKESGRWAGNLLDGMTFEDILMWIKAPFLIRPEHAYVLRVAGVSPTEIDWSWDDQGRMTLAERLARGIWNVQRVITEVEGRRQRRAAGS